MDLNKLNTCGELDGGTIPLDTWLRNAAELAGPGDESLVFRRALGDFTSQTTNSDLAINRLPTLTLPIFGREREIEQLNGYWRGGVAKVVSVVAWAGVGKSALVSEWLKRLRDEPSAPTQQLIWSFYDQGDDQAQQSADLFFADALEQLGDPRPDDMRSRGRRLAKQIASRRTLLVLDGLEVLQHPAGINEGRLRDRELRDLVRALADYSTGLCVITSRFQASDLGDSSSPAAPRMDLEMLSPSAGAALLRWLGIDGSDAELEEASKEVDGHCLTLTLLGTYLTCTGAADIRRRREIGAFEGDTARKVRRALEHYEAWFDGRPELMLLEVVGLVDRPVEEEVLRNLIEQQMPDQALGDRAWNEALSALQRARLVSAPGSGKRRTIHAHPLVRQYFSDQFKRRSPKAFQAAHEGLYEHFRRSVGEERPSTIAALAPLYSAVAHGCRAGLHKRALEEVYWPCILRQDKSRPSISPLQFYSTYILGAFGLELTAIAEFFDGGWSRTVPGLSDSERAFVFMHAGYCLRASGRIDEGATAMKRAIDIRERSSQWDLAASGSWALSGAYLSRGALRDALFHAQEGVRYADLAGFPLPQDYSRAVLAHVLQQEGRRVEAGALLAEITALRSGDRLEPRALYAMMCFRVCDILLDEGRWVDVLALVDDVLPWVSERDEPLATGVLHLCRGRAHMLRACAGSQEALALAMEDTDAALLQISKSSMADWLPLGLLARADLCSRLGRSKEARGDVLEALQLAERDNMQIHIADARILLARLLMDDSEPETASESLRLARQIVESTGYKRCEPTLAALESRVKHERRPW
jgi:tetratricopeptide (TPR) repeat protein